MSLNHISWKFTGEYKLHKSHEKINNLQYMDDIKLFAKNEKELDIVMSYITPLDKQRRPRDIYKYNLYFYSSTATFVWSRNAVRKSLHISFFCGGDHLCLFAQQAENTRELTGVLEWPAGLSLSVQNYRPYIVFQLPRGNMNMPLRPRIFCLWLVIETYKLLFIFLFPVICWSYLRTEISVTLSTGNRLHSLSFSFILIFLVKPLCWCSLATALNLLSSSTVLHRQLS